MPYKQITKDGEKFIRDACKANSNNFSGSLPYSLGRSTASANTTFTAVAKYQNVVLSDYNTLADALIFWINQYSNQYLLDANVIAAQTYIESNYKLWEYSNSGDNNKSSAMGISQLYDNEVWDLFFNNDRAAINNPKDQTLFDSNQSIISFGLSGDTTDIRNIIPYQDNANQDTNTIALGNRVVLFQNIMNNPEIMIQVQCRYMSEIGSRNNNLAASSLFAYTTNGYLTSKTYNEIINNASKGHLAVKPGIDYVDKIFKVLGGKYKSSFEGFGKDYVYDSTPNDQANRNLSGTIVINQSNVYPPVGNSGNFPVSTVKQIVNSLNKFGITNQYLQSGILAVISTEGTFTPISESSYAKTPNARLRVIFTTRLSDLTEAQLAILKGDDIAFFSKVYEGQFGSKYGNTTYGDGFKYRGRGFNQITFKSIYQKIATAIGTDIVGNPDLLNTIPVASDAVAAYFADYFNTATQLGIPSKYYGLNSFSEVNNLTLGTRVAFQANSGWNTNLNTSIYPAEFTKQLASVGKLYSIVTA